MTTSVDELTSLLRAEGIEYHRDPNGPAVRLNLSGHNGTYAVVILVELDGRLVRFWAVGYGACPSGHPHVEAVLRVLAEMNHRFRSTKFGWDSYCGEIEPGADLWLEDATLTRKQLASTLRALLQGIDLGHARIAKTMETGADPDRIVGNGNDPRGPIGGQSRDPAATHAEPTPPEAVGPPRSPGRALPGRAPADRSRSRRSVPDAASQMR